jgi:hypothetical protein
MKCMFPAAVKFLKFGKYISSRVRTGARLTQPWFGETNFY